MPYVAGFDGTVGLLWGEPLRLSRAFVRCARPRVRVLPRVRCVSARDPGSPPARLNEESMERMERLKYHDILYNDDPIGPYPSHLLKRVDRPTNLVPGPIERRAARDSVFWK